MKLRFDPQAVRDLVAIRDYLTETAGSESAERVRLHLKQRMARLLERPGTGISTTMPGVRVLSPTRYPYRIYFTIDGNTIVILHIRHTARQPLDEMPPT
ncbi:MAG: type II toxin-antitoxin system RelE/ParE family toxin [Hyphomicrobium sp.]